MYFNNNLFRFLVYLLTALEISVAYVLLRRRLYREVPWFTTYICFQLLNGIILYSLYESGDPINYFFLAWMGEGISITLAFMVILETFRISVVQYESIRRLGIKLLLGAAIVSVVIALILVPHGAKTSTAMMRFIWVAERSLRIIQLTLVATGFALSSYLALSWRNYVFGIALGYGLFAAASLACQTFIAYAAPSLANKASFLESAAYACTVAIWLIHLLQREPKGPGLPPTANRDLHEWSEALSDLDKAAR